MDAYSTMDDEIKTLQYLYAWLLEDFAYLLKMSKYAKSTVWKSLYTVAKKRNEQIVESRTEEQICMLTGAYEVLRYSVDREFSFTEVEIASRDAERRAFIKENY